MSDGKTAFQEQIIGNIKKAGVPIQYNAVASPQEYDGFNDQYQFPSDVTENNLTNLELGMEHSKWVAALGRVLNTLSVSNMNQLYWDQKYNDLYTQEMFKADIREDDGKKRLKSTIEAIAGQNEEVNEAKDELLIAEATFMLMKNKVREFTAYVDCLSREITRRSMEPLDRLGHGEVRRETAGVR